MAASVLTGYQLGPPRSSSAPADLRWTSSLSSHPTAQGVSLRGIGPSGVSRTLVLADGIPQNDPFGGWVYWTRVPLESVDRIEVVDGSTSSLYGNYAMGGVINIVGNRPARRTIGLKPQYGNHRSPKRSEEHTSELQSPCNLVCRLLLEKKKKKDN